MTSASLITTARGVTACWVERFSQPARRSKCSPAESEMQTEQPACNDVNCCLLQKLYVRRCAKCGDTSRSQGFQDPASHSSGKARLNPTSRQPQVKYDRILDTVVFSIHSGHEFVTRETA